MSRPAKTFQFIVSNSMAVLVLVVAALATPTSADHASSHMAMKDPVRALPQFHGETESYVRLGEKLFFDRRLEPQGRLACADCHNPAKGGGDDIAFSVKANGVKHLTNTPTLFNVRYNQVYYWSGQSYDLSKQLDDALQDLGTDWPQVIQMLNGLPEYRTLFDALFRDGITVSNIKKTLVAYEKSLITPNAPFDRYINGDTAALTTHEVHGYQLFKTYGCIACHQGINLGGNLLVQGDDATQSTLAQQNPASIRTANLIRVPSLRNVAFTAPYFHDGSQVNLDAAINHRPHNGLQSPIPAPDLETLVLFLRTLTGEYQGKML